MNKIISLFLLTAMTFIMSGCVHKMNVMSFKDGSTLDAQYNELNREVKIVMPNGEIMTGQYSAISNATFSMSNTYGSATAYSGSKSATAYGNAQSTTINSGGASQAYALLKSDRSKLMMELIVSYSDWTGHGYGEARTNDGRSYKIQF